jgi:N12 class adenine-specific DNA methylase
VSAKYAEDRSKGWFDLYDEMKPAWDETCTCCEWDFLSAVLEFRNLSIQDALKSEDYIIKILAILDKRVGKRTLEKIKEAEEYKKHPEWVRQFYELRLNESL